MDGLILVDLQNDFMPGGALAVTDGNKVVPVANALAGLSETVVATRDWHPANHGSFVTALGFETWVVEDGCRGVELKPGDVEPPSSKCATPGFAWCGAIGW